MRKKFISLLLAATMITSMFNTVALAANTEEQKTEETQIVCEICGHEHDETCGYVEAVEGQLCTHVHDENCKYIEGIGGSPCMHKHEETCYADNISCIHEHSDDCYPMLEGDVKSKEPTACTHLCNEAGGCVTKELNCTHTHEESCGFVAAMEGVPCNHQHNKDCGFIEAIEGMPCDHECVPEAKTASIIGFQVVDGQLYTTLDGAITEIEGRTDKTGRIALTADATFSGTVMIEPGADITIISADTGKPVTLTRGDENGKIDFSNATLRLDNITLDGGATWGDGENWFDQNNGITSNESLLRAEDNYGSPAELYLNGATIQNCHYYEDTNNAYGAAVCIISAGATLDAKNSTIKNNVCATKDAGNSTKATRGAGIYLQDDSTTHAMTASITNTTLTQNVVLPETSRRNNNGANAFFMGVAVNIDGCTFSNGFANEGAGMYVFFGAEVQLSNTNVEYNKGHQGVGIKIDTTSSASSIVKMTSGSVCNNISIPYVSGKTGGSGVGLEGGSGGADGNYQSIFEMTGGTIEHNSGATYGGGIFNQDSKTIVAGNAIIRNNQADGGGGIMNYHWGYWGAAELSVLDKASIINNTAGLGNAVYVLANDFYLDGRQTTIQGDIFLMPNTYIKLVGAVAGNTFSLSTQSTDASDNRVVVEPGTFNYAGNVYQVTDAEPEIAGFMHNSKKIVTGSSYLSTNPGVTDNTRKLVLGSDVVYKVTFDSQGGSYVSPIGNLASGDKITAPTPPTRTGFEFMGWYQAPSDGDAWDFTTDTITNNMTLYAYWTPTYTVTYAANGGSGTAPAEPTEYEEKATVTVLSNTFTNGSKEFTAWNTQADGKGTSYKANDTFAMPAANVALYAQWKTNGGGGTDPTPNPTYMVSYDANSGSGTAPASPTEYKENATVTVLSNTFTNGSKSFIGWKDGDGKSYSVGTTFSMPAKDVILYAQWKTNDGGGSSTDYTTLTVSKVWENDKVENRPAGVTVQLYKDGKAYGSTVELNNQNNWTYTWTRLDDSYSWTVDEVSVPQGYEKAVTGSGTKYTITNKWVENKPTEPGKPVEPGNPTTPTPPTEPNKLPQTSDTSMAGFWMLMSIISGLGLILVNKRKRCQ